MDARAVAVVTEVADKIKKVSNSFLLETFFIGKYQLLSIYLQAASAATAPSAVAVVICLTAFVRQSPATKMPFMSVRHASSDTI